MYSQAFLDALNTGEVLIRKTWMRKGKVSVQFMQQIDGPSSGGSNKFVAMNNGIENGGKQRVTTIMSVLPNVIANWGLNPEKDYFSENKAVFASTIYGDCDIEVTENTTPNSYMADHQPKINPVTGDILALDGQPIYRHTQLVEEANNQFLKHNGVIDAETGELIEAEAAADSPAIG